MILVDTSAFVQCLTGRMPVLQALLEADQPVVLLHPFVYGELLLGGISGATRAQLDLLLPAPVATATETAIIIDTGLAGKGVGYVDACLLASALLAEARILTLDERLQAVARDRDLAWSPNGRPGM